MSVSIKASNGVGYNYTYKVTTADATAGKITFDFNTAYTPCVVFMTLSSAGVVKTNIGAVLSEPATGQAKIANGSGYTITAGDYIVIVGGIVGTAL